MLARRIIPCLDVADGRVVKGVHFESLRDAGDPVEQAARYDAEGADELVFLDISASHEARDTMLEMVSRVADTIFIPFTVGGGIRSVEDAGRALRAGADKVAVNTAAVRDPDAGPPPGRQLRLPVRGGGGGCAPPRAPGSRAADSMAGPRHRRPGANRRSRASSGSVGWKNSAPAKSCSPRWTGTAPSRGTTSSCCAQHRRRVRIPVIASGGAGNLEHLAEALEAGAHGVLAASIFHYQGCSLPEARAFLRARGFPVRP